LHGCVNLEINHAARGLGIETPAEGSNKPSRPTAAPMSPR
jgi:hypothetical protein